MQCPGAVKAVVEQVDTNAARVDVGEVVDRLDVIVYRYRLKPPGFVYVSGAVTRLLGYTPEDHYEDPELALKLVHPDDRRLLEELTKIGPRTDPLLLRWRRRDGTVFWMEGRNRPVYDDAGEMVAIDGTAREVPDPTLRPGEVIRLLGGLRINLAAQRIAVNGRPVRLTPTEFKVLACLTARPGETVTRDEVMRQVWGSAHTGSQHACETYISGLRRKIEADPRFPERIRTVRGGGYKAVAVP